MTIMLELAKLTKVEVMKLASETGKLIADSKSKSKDATVSGEDAGRNVRSLVFNNLAYGKHSTHKQVSKAFMLWYQPMYTSAVETATNAVYTTDKKKQSGITSAKSGVSNMKDAIMRPVLFLWTHNKKEALRLSNPTLPKFTEEGTITSKVGASTKEVTRLSSALNVSYLENKGVTDSNGMSLTEINKIVKAMETELAPVRNSARKLVKDALDIIDLNWVTEEEVASK